MLHHKQRDDYIFFYDNDTPFLKITLSAIQDRKSREYLNLELSKRNVQIDWSKFLETKATVTKKLIQWITTNTDKEKRLNELRKSYNGCKRCGLYKTRNSIVFGSGNANAKMVLIGEGPGGKEDELGMPFCGRSGNLLTQFLNEAELDRNKDVYILNTIMCRCPKNRKPFDDEIAACQERLETQLDILRPQAIVLLGATACERVLDYTPALVENHGSVINGKYIVSLHPAWFCRNMNKAELGKEPFIIAKKLIESFGKIGIYRKLIWR